MRKIKNLAMSLMIGLLVASIVGSGTESFELGAVLFGVSGVGGVLMSVLQLTPVGLMSTLAWVDTDGTFKKLNAEELKELDAENTAKYLKALHDFALEESKYAKEVTEEQKKELAEIKSKMEKANQEYAEQNAKVVKTLDEVVKASKAQGEFLANLGKEKGGNELDAETVKSLKEIVEAAKSGKNGKFSIKATVLTSAVTNSTVGQRDSEIALAGTRRLTAYDLFPKVTIPANAGGKSQYIDVTAGSLVRSAAATAEGATIPESTIVWTENEKELRTIVDSIPYSEQFEYDYNFLLESMRETLMQNVNIEVDDQIVNGTGVAPNFDGMVTDIANYTPAASGITDANTFDLIMKLKEDIESDAGSKYSVNFVMMNTSDIVSINFMLKKDADNNYIPLGQMLAEHGITLVPNNSVTANTLFVGDSRYAKIIEDGNIVVETGYNGTNFGELEKTLRLHTRKNLRIREADADGFLECISISAALTTLAT